MLLLLSLLACTELDLDDSEIGPPPPDAPPGHLVGDIEDEVIPEVSIPTGEAIYRAECFGRQGEGMPRPMAKRGGGGRSVTTGAPPPPPAAAPAMEAAKMEAEEAEPSMAPMGSGADLDAVADMEDPGPVETAKPEARAPGLDWGATVYLSNDDSMSLASAQRVLWAVDHGRRVPVSEIRPHELLNYFTFDTAPVKRGELFSVQGAGARTSDETLSVALAVKGATPPRKPLDATVVIDRSGSMSAEGRMEYTKRGLHLMEEQLRDGDRVDIVLFDDQVCTPLEDFVVGRDDPALLTRTIDQLHPRGSTDLDKGLKEGYRLATARESAGIKRNQRILLLTDAFLNTGDVNPNTVTEIAAAYEDKGIRLTGIGVGRDFNDDVLDKLTEKGKGAYVYMGSEAVVDRVFGAGFESMTRTIAHDVHFALDLPDTLAMERFYGEEASTVKEDVQPIHYYAGTSQVFLQDLRVDPKKLKPRDELVLTITYRDAATDEPDEQKVKFTVGQLIEADPHNLDKARALMAWTDLLVARAMGSDACGAPLSTYAERAALLQDDAEIGYVGGLVRKTCSAYDPTRAPVAGVAYKVKVDSDQPIGSVSLTCAGKKHVQRLSGSDTVARFEAAPGECTLVLDGAVPMSVAVTVPETGGDVRCIARGGRLSCD